MPRGTVGKLLGLDRCSIMLGCHANIQHNRMPLLAAHLPLAEIHLNVA